MQENNLDINLVIQSFQEKVNQLITENVVKDATIKQLSAQIDSLMSQTTVAVKDDSKKDK